jgi:hypothetical protein
MEALGGEAQRLALRTVVTIVREHFAEQRADLERLQRRQDELLVQVLRAHGGQPQDASAAAARMAAAAGADGSVRDIVAMEGGAAHEKPVVEAGEAGAAEAASRAPAPAVEARARSSSRVADLVTRFGGRRSRCAVGARAEDSSTADAAAGEPLGAEATAAGVEVGFTQASAGGACSEPHAAEQHYKDVHVAEQVAAAGAASHAAEHYKPVHMEEQVAAGAASGSANHREAAGAAELRRFRLWPGARSVLPGAPSRAATADAAQADHDVPDVHVEEQTTAARGEYVLHAAEELVEVGENAAASGSGGRSRQPPGLRRHEGGGRPREPLPDPPPSSSTRRPPRRERRTSAARASSADSSSHWPDEFVAGSNAEDHLSSLSDDWNDLVMKARAAGIPLLWTDPSGACGSDEP